jgi:hypothetical protein
MYGPDVRKRYRFPAATLVVFRNRTCREFPNFCPFISVPRARKWVADALRELRRRQRRAAR